MFIKGHKEMIAMQKIAKITNLLLHFGKLFMLEIVFRFLLFYRIKFFVLL